MKHLLLLWFFYGVSIVSGGYRMVLPCDQPKSNRGPCDGRFPRWSFDMDLNQCVLFSWTGCMGNHNRFRIKKECIDACIKIKTNPKLVVPPAYRPPVQD